MTTNTSPVLPPSATHPLVVVCGLVTFAVAVMLLRQLEIFQSSYARCAYIGAATGLGLIVPDVLWRKIYLKNLSIEALRPGSWTRVLTKCAGLAGSMGFIGLLYWVFPEYASGDNSFYARYWEFMKVILPFWIALSPGYIWWIDRRQKDPQDALWQTGRLMTGQWTSLAWPAIWQNILGWLVKGFFFPLMFVFNCNNVDQAVTWNLEGEWSFDNWYNFIYFAVFFVDCAFAFIAYLISMRALDSQINTVEPTFLGWAVALMCYPPLTNFFGDQYLRWDNHTIGWQNMFREYHVLYVVWGSAILVLLAIFAWATVIFGTRFSNLTNRGIITSGPYRFSKHPAYIAKNLSWWMASMPFVVNESIITSTKNCILLAGFSLLYYLRAKTEERHLSLDPVYRQYAAWIDENGIFRWMNRIPYLRRISSFKLTFSGAPQIGTFPVQSEDKI